MMISLLPQQGKKMLLVLLLGLQGLSLIHI